MVARGSGAEGVKIYSLFLGFFFSPERERDEKPPFYLFFVSLSLRLSLSLSNAVLKFLQPTRSFVRSFSLSLFYDDDDDIDDS
jgi:hypothetical protein